MVQLMDLAAAEINCLRSGPHSVYERASQMYRWVFVGVIIVIVFWLGGRRARAKRESMTDADVATVIHGYLHGGPGGGWDWGEFVDYPFRNPRLEHIRSICKEGESKLPAQREAFLDELVRKLQSGQFD